MLVDKLEPIIARYDEITALLQTPEILNDITKLKTLSKEQSDMEILVQKAREYLATLEQIEQNKQLFLQADKEVPYGVVVDVMGRIRAAGIDKLGMVAQRDTSSEATGTKNAARATR